MADPELWQHYRDSGIEIDAADYLNALGAKFEPEQADRFAAARWAGADKFLSVVGERVSERDFPTGVSPDQRGYLLGSLNEDGRNKVSRLALYHECTPASHYWDEAADQLFKVVSPSNATIMARSKEDQHQTFATLSDASTLLSRRSRTNSELRGDKESLEAFSALLTNPNILISPENRMDLAGHYFAHARIQQRSKRQFLAVEANLPAEAGPICKAIRDGNLEADLVENMSFMKSLSEPAFADYVASAQHDLLDVATQGLKTNFRGSPSMSRKDRSVALAQVSATRKLVDQAQGDGLYSPAMNKASQQLFSLSKVTDGAEIMLVAPEASRRMRMAEHTKENVDFRKAGGREM